MVCSNSDMSENCDTVGFSFEFVCIFLCLQVITKAAN